MKTQPEIDPQHSRKRGILRFVGFLTLASGAIATLIALLDFARALSNMHSGPPSLFWLAFLGLPLMWLGFVLTTAGFAGSVQRYLAGESAPVAKDTFNYMAEGTRDGLKTAASAVGQGLASGMGASSTPGIRCHKCNATNEGESKFCKACGAAMAKTKACPGCDELNDPDAKFCDNCGKRLD